MTRRRMSLHTAAQEYDVPYATIYTAVRSGALAAKNVAPGKGTRWSVSIEDLDAWIDTLQDAS